MLNGIISAFVLATDKHGNLDADYACIEVDEIASVGVLPKIEPDCALLTNISRDQLDRFGEVDITYNKLMTAVTSVPKTMVSASRYLTMFHDLKYWRAFFAANAERNWNISFSIMVS